MSENPSVARGPLNCQARWLLWLSSHRPAWWNMPETTVNNPATIEYPLYCWASREHREVRQTSHRIKHEHLADDPVSARRSIPALINAECTSRKIPAGSWKIFRPLATDHTNSIALI